ncbi:MAG TPA: c-type cytochrome [Vicinamibacterales bacterium]|jgi:mono/diheme cytochrome c family protein|nr:c-type cytochrome [Vicinamibacterales bacterium]
MRVLACCLSFVLAVSSLGAQQPAGTIVNPVPPAAKSVAAGRQSFQRYCAPCHNDDGKGNGPLAPRNVHPPDLTDAEWLHGGTDGEIFTSIREGIGPKFDMKSMKSRMTDAEIWNIVNYLRSIGPKP